MVLACSGNSSSHRPNLKKPPPRFERGENLLQNGILNFAFISVNTDVFMDFVIFTENIWISSRLRIR